MEYPLILPEKIIYLGKPCSALHHDCSSSLVSALSVNNPRSSSHFQDVGNHTLVGLEEFYGRDLIVAALAFAGSQV